MECNNIIDGYGNSIRAIVICNLHSYAGGRNPWGKPSSGRRLKVGCLITLSSLRQVAVQEAFTTDFPYVMRMSSSCTLFLSTLSEFDVIGGKQEGFEEQRCDDGLLEIMGLKDGWHSAFVLLEVSTAVRLCQVSVFS